MRIWMKEGHTNDKTRISYELPVEQKRIHDITNMIY